FLRRFYRLNGTVSRGLHRAPLRIVGEQERTRFSLLLVTPTSPRRFRAPILVGMAPACAPAIVRTPFGIQWPQCQSPCWSSQRTRCHPRPQPSRTSSMCGAAPSSIPAVLRQTGAACVEVEKARPTADATINALISVPKRTCAALLANGG